MGEFIDKAVVLKGTVTQPPVPSSGGGLTLTLEAEEVVSRGKAVPAKGRVWVYVPREVSADYLDVLEIVGELRPTLFSDRRDAAWMALGDARLLRKVGEREEGFVEAASRRMRSEVVEVLKPVLPGGYREFHARLLGSLFFGTHGAGLPRGLIESFRQTGTIHVLVVSGTQISLLFMVVYFPGLFAHWQRRRRIQAQLRMVGSDTDIRPGTSRLPGLPRLLPSPLFIGAGLGLMCIYALLTQGGTPVTRAAVMAGLVGISLFLRHFSMVADHHSLDIDRYTLLAAAAMGILAINPAALSEVGFQLSFAAVLGIAFLAPKLRGLLGSMNDFWAYLIAAPVSAQLAVLPLVGWHFGTLPVIGFISNLVIVPIAALLLWLGLAAFALGAVWWVLAWPLGWACGQLCWLMTRSVALFAAMPGGVVHVKSISWMAVAAYFAALSIGGGLLGLLFPRRKDELAGLEDKL